MLCEKVNYLIKIGVTNEDPFHNALEEEFKNIYNWPPQHIKHKPSVKIGSETKYPDIVLEGDGFGIIIEVKAPGIILGDDQAGQLISYISNYYTDRDSIRCKYGLLIGGGIKVYFQDDPNKKPQLITSFNFDVDSFDGNSLSEILLYDECSDEKLKKFIDRIMEEGKYIRLKNDLLENNGAKIKEILKNKLISEGYEEEILNNILDNININSNEEKNQGLTQGNTKQPAHNKFIFLDKVMEHYNSICDKKFMCYGKKYNDYRQIAIINGFKPLHYEFKIRDYSSIGVEIHTEQKELKGLNDVIISSFTGKTIKGYTIGLYPVKGKEKEYLQIRVPFSAGKEECSLVMKELINLTYEKIRDEYKKLKI
jgi:hypothetical protein